MKVISGIAILVISLISTEIRAASSTYCGELINPHDYIDGDKRLLGTVEQYHFTSNVESLRHGNSGPVGGELSYTLMMFPNHHRALAALSKLSLRDKTLKPHGAKYSVGCFFDRAIRFKPNDAMVRMVYGDYLLKSGQTDKATEELGIAVDLEPENPNINYNLGLLYLKQKNYEQAKTYAKKAYELGFPLPGLKNQLKQAGKWDE
ncbi:MAG: hypothetical protein K0S36_232 [Nitrosospira multiformis]|jgi:tetratricopeptide (TPR) repeat protein|nr:hypothetical protein [Nitrosospira multiformis]